MDTTATRSDVTTASDTVDPLRAPVCGILHEGRVAYITVVASQGPQLSPALYSISHGKIWFFAASGTLKERSKPVRGAVCMCVAVGDPRRGSYSRGPQ
jgi:hypothetical protein